jgi:CheY-like chemotaxis protein/HPt (histidine-containing phosphotransfer) domain-containing protein
VPTRVKGDPGRLRQVLLNLANNAIKFTDKGEVLIRVGLKGQSESHATLKFEVKDTGVGIPAGRMSHLFKPFSQVDASTTRRYGGTGLGLAISKRIVGAMGGELRAKTKEGAGSAFSFTAVLGRYEEDRRRSQRLRITNIQGLAILIVDDNATSRQMFREMLKAWGCHPEEAGNGHKALEMLHAAVDTGKPFQLALLDYQMPELDGGELARRIKADPKIAGIPLILLTSSPRRGDGTKMSQLGFDAYLTKPIKQWQLYEAITTVLSLRKSAETAKPRALITRHTLKEAARGKCKILVVEDNIVNQKLVVRLLEKARYRCDVAANGLEAVEALSRIPYDLVFMDCHMPEMDGYKATAEIRRREGNSRHTPIVAMTARALKGDRERCLEAGMDDYISKPMRIEAIQAVLDKYIPSEPSLLPPSHSETPAIDLKRLRDLSGGDVEFERDILMLLLSDTDERIAELESALRDQDALLVRRIAHTIKGASANAGAKKLGKIAYEIEKIGAHGGLDQAPDTLTHLKSELERVRSYLQDYLRR